MVSFGSIAGGGYIYSKPGSTQLTQEAAMKDATTAAGALMSTYNTDDVVGLNRTEFGALASKEFGLETETGSMLFDATGLQSLNVESLAGVMFAIDSADGALSGDFKKAEVDALFQPVSAGSVAVSETTAVEPEAEVEDKPPIWESLGNLMGNFGRLMSKAAIVFPGLNDFWLQGPGNLFAKAEAIPDLITDIFGLFNLFGGKKE